VVKGTSGRRFVENKGKSFICVRGQRGPEGGGKTANDIREENRNQQDHWYGYEHLKNSGGGENWNTQQPGP